MNLFGILIVIMLIFYFKTTLKLVLDIMKMRYSLIFFNDMIWLFLHENSLENVMNVTKLIFLLPNVLYVKDIDFFY